MQVLTSSQRSNQMVLYLMATAELQCCTAPDQADSIKIQPRARSHTLCCLPVVSFKYLGRSRSRFAMLLRPADAWHVVAQPLQIPAPELVVSSYREVPAFP
jgi:hypothetical protein